MRSSVGQPRHAGRQRTSGPSRQLATGRSPLVGCSGLTCRRARCAARVIHSRTTRVPPSCWLLFRCLSPCDVGVGATGSEAVSREAMNDRVTEFGQLHGDTNRRIT